MDTAFSWAALLEQLKGSLHLQTALHHFTAWRIGGVAEAVLIPKTFSELSLALAFCPQAMPIIWLGLGSNVLVPDAGLHGLVIVTHGSLLSQMRILNEETGLIYAQAGAPCAQLARFCARQHWQGLEFMAGIPGTVGGALRMNAGCWGGETWDTVTQVETMDRQGRQYLRKKHEFILGYRNVILPQPEYFLGAYFQLSLGDKVESLQKIKSMLEKRHQSQPTHLPSCGSVFKNPVGQYAAALIEACGLKGYRQGGAQISEKHANFIVNLGAASAGDILAIMHTATAAVQHKFGITLEPEVKIL